MKIEKKNMSNHKTHNEDKDKSQLSNNKNSKSFLYTFSGDSTLESFSKGEITVKKELLKNVVKEELQEAAENIVEEVEVKKKTYWTDETEKAVADYLKIDCNYYEVQILKHKESCAKKGKGFDEDFLLLMEAQFDYTSNPKVLEEKEKIFRESIKTPLNRLVENIIFNFGLFIPGIDVKTVHNDCVGHVYQKFANFELARGKKSFSYFGTVAKHYLMGIRKDYDKTSKTNLHYENHKEEADGMKVTTLEDDSELEYSLRLFNKVIDEIEQEILKKGISENDAKVGDAIVAIFRDHENIGAYNKNQVYQLIKERTGLETKDITYSLHRFRIFYRMLKQDFIKEEDER